MPRKTISQVRKKSRLIGNPRKREISPRSPKTGAPKAKGGRSKTSQADKSARAIRVLKLKLAAAQARIDELQAWADTDFLLNIYNRRGFERELGRALAYIRRYKATGALVVLDVDRLKPVNDRFGHAAGDIVLKGVVAVLMRHVRSSDIVARLGGDEFGLLLWNLSESDARAKASALEDAIDRLTFVFKGQAVTSGASAGVAMLDPASEGSDVVAQADRAMYARKNERRDSGSRASGLRR